jgi:hypothetical protein
VRHDTAYKRTVHPYTATTEEHRQKRTNRLN